MAGQDAQLLLKVGLDLTAFRQSLAGLGAASAGYSLPINVKISRDALNKELANLTTALGKKKFKVELNIAGGLTESQLGKIQERLKTLAETKKVEIPVSVIARASKEDLRKVVASLNRSVRYSDALVKGKLRVPATIVSSITKADVNAFAADTKKQLKAQTKAVQQSKPAAMEVAVDEAKFRAFVNRLIKGPLVELHAAMRKAGIGMAGAGEGGVAELKAAILSGIPQLTSDISKGIAQGLDPKMKERGGSGAKNLIDGFKEGTGIASPSKVFKQLGSFLVEGLEIGFTDRFKTFKGKALAQVRDFVSALRIELAKVENITGRAGAGAMSAAPRGGKAYLSPAGPLPLNSREPWTPKAGGGYSPYMGGAWPATPSRFRALPPVANALKYTQWAGPLRPALPPAGMTTGSIARQAKVQARIAQAYVRSAERNAGEYGQPGRLALPSGEMRVQSRVAALMKGYRIGGKNQGYSAPIGPLSEGSAQPWATGSRGMHGQSGFEPRLRSSALGPKVEDPWVGQAGKAIGASITKAIAAIPAQKLLPMAGQTSYQGRLRSMFAGLPAIKSPSISKAGEESLSERGSYLLGKARRTLGLSGTYGQASVGASGLAGIAQQRLSPMAGGSTQFGGIPSALQNSATQASSATGKFATLKDALSSLGDRAAQVARSVAREGRRAVGISSFGDNRRMILRQRHEINMEYDLMGVTRRRNAAGISYAPGSAPAPSIQDSPRRTAPSSPLSLDYYKNAVKYQAALETATNFSRNFTASQLPIIGGLQNVALEFGQAAKQVLLYGTAYRGLAFISSLPGQILNAAKSQQQYTNALKVSTKETGTFAKEMLFIDNVQRGFGLNLETTREGFVKLYASMAPTGFDSGSIEKLFTGISAATAALQLTPDKAERVIYAFGQMASKGQIMSEELKGQLGDVLPGALAIFAKAAGMSVKEFSQAMEDGAFTGNRFREVFAKVSDELITRFGTGAQVAGKSLQGLINTVGGDFTRTLESFAPLADSAAQAVLTPLSGMLKDLGTAAKIAMGEMERIQAQIKDAKQIVVDLKVGGADPAQIKAAETNVLALQKRYEELNVALKDPAMVQRVNDIQKFTAELAKAGTFVMNVAGAIGKMLSPIINILGTNLTTVISLITSFYVGFQTARLAAMALMGVLLLYRNLSALLGFGAAANGARALAGVFTALGVATTGATVSTVGLRLAMTALVSATVIGAVVGGIMLLAGAFASMRDRAKEASEESKNAIDNSAKAATMGRVQEVTTNLNEELAKNRAVSKAYLTLEKIYQRTGKEMKLGNKPIISVEEMAQLKQGAEYSNEIAGIISGNQMKKGGIEIQAFLGQDLGRAREQAGQISGMVRKSSVILRAQQQQAIQEADRLGLNKPTPGPLPIEGETEADRKKREAQEEKKARLQDKLAGREQQLAIDAANRQTALDDSTFAHKLAMSDAHYDHLKALQDDSFNREMSGLDSIEARQKKFQQDLKAIESRRIESIRKAEIDAQKAVQDFRTASVKAGAASGSGGAPRGISGGAYLQGSIGPTSTGPHFDVKKQGGEFFPRNYLDPYVAVNGAPLSTGTTVRGGTFAGHQARGSHGWDYAFGPGRHAATLKGGAEWMGGVPTEHGEKRKFKIPTGEIFSFLHGRSEGINPQPISAGASTVGLKTRPGEYAMGRREDKTSGQLAVEMLGMQQGEEKKLLAIRYANKLAIEQTVTTIRQNIDTIFPVKEQQLENDLLELRNKLELKGVSREVIDMEVQKTKNAKESAAAQASAMEERISLETALKQLQGKKTLTEDESIYMGYLVEKIAALNQEMASLPSKQEAFNVQLARTAELVAAQKTPQAILANTAAELQKQYAEMTNLGTVATNVASTISGAFGTAFQGVISGSMTAQQALSSFFKSVGEAFMDMAAKMIAKWMEMQIIGLVQSLLGAGLGALGGGFGLGGAGSGTGGAVGSLGGAMSPTTSLPSFSGGEFGSFSGGDFGVTSSFGSFAGGVKTFAEGGIPPIGVPSLVGEQGPELFVPRTAGTVIPSDTTAAAMARYQRQGSSSAPSAMEGLPAAAGGIPILSMSFETTQFMGQDWVSKDQLVAAMAATEKRATAAGAKAGAQQVATKMRTSPAFRRQVGVK
jgi:tape measure domain-containing protein